MGRGPSAPTDSCVAEHRSGDLNFPRSHRAAQTQWDPASRLIRQSTSVRSVRSSSAPRCAPLAELQLHEFETASSNHFFNFYSAFFFRPLVCCARTARPEFAREENQRCPDQAGASQQPEAIEKPKECRLLLNYPRQLCFRVQSRVRGSEAVRRKISRQRAECFLIARLNRRGVRH